MKRIIAVNSNCYHGYSIEEALRGIAEAGFHYVELTATKGWTEHVFPDQSFEQPPSDQRRPCPGNRLYQNIYPSEQ